MSISINNIIETISNPSGRFTTAKGILPRFDDNHEIIFTCSRDMACFSVTWNRRPYVLKCIFNNSRFPAQSLSRISSYLQHHKNPYFVDYRFCGKEMLIYDDKGKVHYCDIILMEEPDGIPLDRFYLEKCDVYDIILIEKIRKGVTLIMVDLLNSEIILGGVKSSKIIVGNDLSFKFIDYESMIVPAMDSYDAAVNNDNGSMAIVAINMKILVSNPDMYRGIYYVVNNKIPFRKQGIMDVLTMAANKAGSRPMVELLDMFITDERLNDKERFSTVLEELAYDNTSVVITHNDILDLAGIKTVNIKPASFPMNNEINYKFYDMVFPMEESLHSVSKGDRWGYVNGQGNWIIEPIYEWADNFAEGRAVVLQGGEYGLIDKDGVEVMPTIYEDITWDCDHQVVIAVQEGKVGIFDRYGNNTAPFKYDYTGDMSCNLMAVRHEGKCGYINKNGDVVIDFILDYASDFINDTALVIHEGVHKIIFTTGVMAEIPESKTSVEAKIGMSD